MGYVIGLCGKRPFHYLAPFILFSFLFVSPLKAQSDRKQPRILIVLDESSSMSLSWVQNKQRVAAAKELILSIMDSVYSVNPNVEFALRAFGEQYNVRDNNCSDSKLEVSFSKNNKTQMLLRLDDLHPLGVTPIAYSLRQAADNDMADQLLYYYGLILITDGEESCNGNLCDVMKNFVNSKINYKPYIINLSNELKLKDVYDCMGNYLQATKPEDIPKTAGIIKERFRPDLTKIVKKEPPVVIKQEPIKINIPEVSIYKPGPFHWDMPLKHLRNGAASEDEPERFRVPQPHIAIYKPDNLRVDIKISPLKRPMASEIDPEPYRLKVREPGFVIYRPEVHLSIVPLRMKQVATSELEPEPYRLKVAEPRFSYYRPEVHLSIQPMRMKQVAADELSPEPFRLKVAEPSLSFYRPDMHVVIKPAALSAPAISELDPEVYRLKVKEPVLNIYRPEDIHLAIRPHAMNNPALSELEPDKIRITTPDVTYSADIVHIKAEMLRMNNLAPADLEPEKIKFPIPDVAILQLPPFKPAKAAKQGRMQPDEFWEEVRLNQPFGLCVDNAGNLYIADHSNNRIRKVGTDGIITTIAGNGGENFGKDGVPATSTTIFGPRGMVFDDDGNLVFSDRNNHRIRKIDKKGIISTIAGNGEGTFTADSGYALNLPLYRPTYLVKGPNGNIYAADSGRVWKIYKDGTMKVVAGNGYSHSVADADESYVRIVGDNRPAKEAYLRIPRGIAVDNEDNLYIADKAHFRIRKVDREGIITTFAGTGEFGFVGDGARAKMSKLNILNDLLADREGNLYFTDGDVVRKINSQGRIYIVAGNGRSGYSGDGGPATDASLWNPAALAIDNEGNLYIADAWNNVVRKVDTKGIITTVAGCGKAGYLGDGWPAVHIASK
ncbi:MAG: VWA domain-containing protein [Bacteroidetes bacterium]|nr:VWA domain-containing protein [Bacteroidota bacterium]